MPTTCVEDDDDAGISKSPQITYGGGFSLLNRCYHSGTGNASLNFTVSSRQLSSQAGASSTKEDDHDGDLEDGFSELETPAGDDENENLLNSNTEQSDDSEDVEDPHNELELSDAETGEQDEKKSRRGRAKSELFKEIMDAPGLSIHTALDKWVEEGKELSREEISLTMVNLRRRKMFGRAMQVVGSKFIFASYLIYFNC